MNLTPPYQEIIRFWFEELGPKLWFAKDPQLDRSLARRFGDLHLQAARCECSAWRDSAEGRLAEILLLDQFSRNIYRDQAQAFAQDPLALGLAQEAIRSEAADPLPLEKRVFIYMPFMHSESKIIHQTAVRLFSRPGMEKNLDFELRHKEIIDRFGRFPHRNRALGRDSTPEELVFLQQPGSHF